VTKQIYLTTLAAVHQSTSLSQDGSGSGAIESVFLFPAWFVKKAASVGDEKERYFVFKGKEISYYEGEQDGRPFGLKGSFVIAPDAKVTVNDIELEIETQGRVWQITARTTNQAKMWAEAVVKASKGAVVIPKLKAIDPNKSDDKVEVAVVEEVTMKPCWFIKKDEEMETSLKAFFVYSDFNVLWYLRAIGGSPKELKGTLPIRKCTSIQTSSPTMFVIHTTSLLKWVLVADSPEIANAWTKALREIIPSSPDLEMEHVQHLTQHVQDHGESLIHPEVLQSILCVLFQTPFFIFMLHIFT
jgi:hypothetical protein